MFRKTSEQELARLCTEKDRRAEDELYRRYAARLLTLTRRYCPDPDDALDLMQDAIIKALDSISTFTYSGDGSLYAWISRIAVNMALNHITRYRNRMISLEVFSREQIPEPEDSQETDLERIPEEEILKMISRLPQMQRTIFNMFCMDGYAHREISSMLSISEKGSASLLAKARKRLKKEINEYLRKTE